MKILQISVVVAGLLLLTAAGRAAAVEAEVVHWWVSGSESAALKQVKEHFESLGNHWLDTPVETSYQAKSIAVARILDGMAPTMVQWHSGVALAELYHENIIRDLSPLAESQGWFRSLPPLLREQISVDSQVVAVPMTVHGSNWLWGNAAILAELGLSMPRSWDEFRELAPKIRQAGYIPLAVGDQPWQVRTLFLNLLLGLGGPELYRSVVIDHDPAVIESREVIDILTRFRQLKSWIDPGSPGRGWAETTALVIDGQAAFQVMGDWAKGEFLQAGKQAEQDFFCEPSPGTGRYYVIVSDAFVAPVTDRESVREAQEALIASMVDPEVQRRFNLAKGSVSPWTDISLEGFDPCARKAVAALAGGALLLPSFSMTNKGIMASTIEDLVYRFWSNPELTAAEAAGRLAAAIRQIEQ